MARTVEEAPPAYESGFAVVVEREVGYVSFGGGSVPPHVAAFQIIAEADEQGVYKFPMPDGRTCVVDVSWEGEAR